MICVETRHMRAVLKAQINETDRNDARHSADDAGGALSPGSCEDVTQSETAHAADPSLRQQISVLHRRLRAIVRDDDVCRRLMTVPGVGPVVPIPKRSASP